MMRRGLSGMAVILALIVLAMPCLALSAETDPETGKEVYSDLPAFKYVQDDGSLTVIEYYGGNTYESIVLPNAIQDPISEIRSGAFLGASPEKVKAVYLPDTLMKLGKDVFRKGMRIVVYSSGDYRAFASSTRNVEGKPVSNRLLKDPDTSMLTVKKDTKYGEIVKKDGVSYRLDGISATVTGYEGNANELRIASEIGTLPVTAVESGALSDAKLRKLYLPSSVTTVEEGAVGPYEVILRADAETPVVPSETPRATEPERNPVMGTAEIGTYDMSRGEFVTTEAEERDADAESDTEEAEESGEISGEESRDPASDDPSEDGKKGNDPENGGEKSPEEENRQKRTSPWLFAGIGIAAVSAAAIGTVLLVREAKKRKRREKRRRN